jgi:tRNA-dihydrouridine synthase 3
MPKVSEISDTPPFHFASVLNPHTEFPSVDLNTSCPVFTETGECRCALTMALPMIVM